MAAEKSQPQEGDDNEGDVDPVVARWLTQATDGDEKAQLALGCHYLSLAENENADASSALLAVDWLIKASRQGSEMATERLKECQRRNIGITSDNAEDLEWCVTTSRFEKEAREAARQLFYRLKPFGVGDGSGTISAHEFAAGIGLLSVNKNEKKLLEKAGKLGVDKVVSESDFVNSVIRRLYGHGGGSSLFATEGDWDAFHQATWMTKLTRYPGMAMSSLVDTAIDTAGSQGALWLRTLVPVNQIYTLVAVVIYSAVSIEAVLWLLPLLVFYMAFAILFVVTAQMLRSRKRLGDIRAIAGILNRFTEVMFDAETAASAYSWKSLKPYATFFVVLPICVAALSVADCAWIPSPEMMALSGAASVTCFLALNDRYDKLAICSILIDVTFTSLLGTVKLLPKIPLIHSLLWYTAGPGYSLHLPIPGLRCMISLPSLAFCIVPFIFVGMAAKRSWRGTYQILVPHLVCFFWWRLSVIFFGRSTWLGLARALVGWVGLILMLPLIGAMIVVYMFYGLFHAMSLANVLKIVTTVALIIGASSYAMWSRSGFRIGSRFSLEGKTPLSRAALLLVLIIGSCVPFAMIFTPSSEKSDLETLSLSTYHKVCVQTGSHPTMCAHYAGAPVSGFGSIVKISVIRLENPAEAFTAWLPSPAADWLRCAYGAHYPDDCESITDSEELREACAYNVHRGRQCHLRDLDRYTYEILVSVSLNQERHETIRLIASDWFREPASFIRTNHDVFFRAKLSDVVGNSGLTLGLGSIECKNCDNVEVVKFSVRSTWHILASLRTALHAVWNFFLSPLFVFA